MEIAAKNRIVFFYLMLLAFHVAHILEETWGHFWIIDSVFGLDFFLLINWLLFCLPLSFLYFFLLDNKTAHYLSMVYACVMVLNGISHNIATIVTGRYFHGFAGGFTGIGLIVLGVSLGCLLVKDRPG
jgi:hypothetical protein